MENFKIELLTGFCKVNGRPAIDPDKVRFIPDYNVRDKFDPDTCEADSQLFQNMNVNGFKADSPIIIRPVQPVANGPWYADVIAGHRRIDSARLVNASVPVRKNGKPGKRLIEGVTFLLEAKGPDGTGRSPVEMSYDLELSNIGKPLAPAERGANILRLRAMGESDDTIAQRLGIGTRWVKDLANLVTKAEPRLLKLVKAGVIPPATAVNLIRAHGSSKASEIAERAKGNANARGKANATSQDVEKAEASAGVTGKVGAKNKGAKGPDARDTSKAESSVKLTVAPLAKAMPGPKGTLAFTLTGPFRVGTDVDDCVVYDGNGAELAELADSTVAKAVNLLLGLGWNVVKGRASQEAEANAKAEAEAEAARVLASLPKGAKASKAAKAKAEAEAERVKAEAAKAEAARNVKAARSEAEAEAARSKAEAEASAAKAVREAERQARVARQVAPVAAKAEAKAEAVKAEAAKMGAGKPLAALAMANGAKVKAAKAEAAKAEAARLASEAEAEAALAEAALAEAAKAAKSNGTGRAARK